VEVGEDLRVEEVSVHLDGEQLEREMIDRGARKGRKEGRRRTSTSKSIGIVFNTCLPGLLFFSFALTCPLLRILRFFFAGRFLPHSGSFPSLSSSEASTKR
jgi:hypothetical protein